MPIYEYRCTDCGHSCERLMSNSSDSNPDCPQCGKRTEKLVSSFAAKAGGSCCDGSPDAGGSCCSGGSCGCH
jgi:putative FmdB family regulatory protein